MTGYVTSGRFLADAYLEQVQEARRMAAWCKRNGMRHQARQFIRDYLRARQNYHYHKARISR